MLSLIPWLKHRDAIEAARVSGEARILAGGRTSDSEGFFVNPTLIEIEDSDDALLRDELFGPIVTVFVYSDDGYDAMLARIDATSPYGLTWAVFATARASGTNDKAGSVWNLMRWVSPRDQGDLRPAGRLSCPFLR